MDVQQKSYLHFSITTSLVAQMIKNPPAVQETRVWSPVQEDPLEKGIATPSSILAWRVPRTEEPGGLQSTGSQRVGHDWVTNTFTFASWFPPANSVLEEKLSPQLNVINFCFAGWGQLTLPHIFFSPHWSGLADRLLLQMVMKVSDGSLQWHLDTVLFNPHNNSYGGGPIPTLQMRKLSFKKLRQFAQDHTARRQWSWKLDSESISICAFSLYIKQLTDWKHGPRKTKWIFQDSLIYKKENLIQNNLGKRGIYDILQLRASPGFLCGCIQRPTDFAKTWLISFFPPTVPFLSFVFQRAGWKSFFKSTVTR